MDGHRAPVIAIIGFLALFIIHWAAVPGAAERPLPAGSRTGLMDNDVSGSYTAMQYGQACPGMSGDADPSSAAPFFEYDLPADKQSSWNDDVLPGGATLKNRALDILPEVPVPTGKDEIHTTPRIRVLSPESMTSGPIWQQRRAGRGLLVSGRMPDTTPVNPAGAVLPAESGCAFADRRVK